MNLSLSKNLTQYSRKKFATDCCDPDETLAYCKDYLNYVIGEYRISLGWSSENINYSTFPLDWTKLCNIHWGGEIFKVFSAGSTFTGQIFCGKLPRVDSAGVMRQGVLKMAQKYQLIFSHSRTSFSWISFSIAKFQLNLDIICVQFLCLVIFL